MPLRKAFSEVEARGIVMDAELVGDEDLEDIEGNK